MTRCLVLAFTLTACHSAGLYGHAVHYVPLDEEARAQDGSSELDPVMVRRFPEDYRKKSQSVFGVVQAKTAGAGGLAYVTLGQRRLMPRNLCSNLNDEDSCRVSVTEQDFGVVHALLQLRPEDESSRQPVLPGSLIHVIGKLEAAVDKDDGAPVLRALYYRHFPPRTYRTRRDAETMRQ
jgi:hypothetical protein